MSLGYQTGNLEKERRSPMEWLQNDGILEPWRIVDKLLSYVLTLWNPPGPSKWQVSWQMKVTPKNPGQTINWFFRIIIYMVCMYVLFIYIYIHQLFWNPIHDSPILSLSVNVQPIFPDFMLSVIPSHRVVGGSRRGWLKITENLVPKKYQHV